MQKQDKDKLFNEGCKLAALGKYIASARCFRAAAELGHAEAPLDCSILFDAMLCSSREEARNLFFHEALNGNAYASAFLFLSWLDFSEDFRNFDLIEARLVLKQAKNLKSELAACAAGDFIIHIIKSKSFRAFCAKVAAEAKKGNPLALRIKGDMCSTGIGLKASTKMGIASYSAAAAKGDEIALCRLGIMQLRGRLSKEKIKKAYMLLRTSAGLGVLQAVFETGNIVLNFFDMFGLKQEDALPHLLLAASRGFAPAMRIIGKMYFYGNLLEEDRDRGLKMLEQAHKAGDALGSLEAGLAYYHRGPLQQKENFKKALELFTAAAERGEPEGWKMLGRMFFKGQVNGKKDEFKAWTCFEEAVGCGSLTARYDLALLFYERSSEADFQKAYRIFLSLAKDGHVPSQFYAGTMLKDGLGAAADIKTAVFWLNKAAKAGYGEASYMLFEMLLRGIPAQGRPLCIKRLLLKAVKDGSPSARELFREGRKTVRLPIMFKEQFFEIFLNCMKKNYISDSSEENLSLFAFALAQAELIVPIKTVKDCKDKGVLRQGANSDKLCELGSSLLGTKSINCSAVICGNTYGEKFLPVFSSRSEIPHKWLELYRFVQVPSDKLIEMFTDFIQVTNTKTFIALDAFSKMLKINKETLSHNIIPEEYKIKPEDNF